MYAPLFRLLLTIAFETIAAREEHVHEDRYWFFLDEVHTLGDIKLDEQLTTLRKYGVCVVSGVQSDSQFNESMGQDRGAIVMNCFSSVLMLAAFEENMQKRMSARLGVVDVDVVSRNQALAVTESRDGAGLTRMDKEKPLVMPAGFGELDACHGYLKLSGSYPAAAVNYSGWLKGWFWNPRRIDRWIAKLAMPAKDPQFEIVRAHTENVIASITTGMQEAQKKGPAPDDFGPAGESPVSARSKTLGQKLGAPNAANPPALCEDRGLVGDSQGDAASDSGPLPAHISAEVMQPGAGTSGRTTRVLRFPQPGANPSSKPTASAPRSEPKEPAPASTMAPLGEGGQTGDEAELTPTIGQQALSFDSRVASVGDEPRKSERRPQKEQDERLAQTPPLIPPLDLGATRQLDM